MPLARWRIYLANQVYSPSSEWPWIDNWISKMMLELSEYFQTFDNLDTLCNIQSNLPALSANNIHFA
jgi:hypothetical protein